jgi:hypothetical protein
MLTFDWALRNIQGVHLPVESNSNKKVFFLMAS